MKHQLLLGALIFGSTSTVAAPVHFTCTEASGRFTEEGKSVLQYNDTERITYTICPLVNPRSMKYENSEPECHAMHLASSDAEPYFAVTIEFNWNTNEALAIIPRGNPLYFAIEETEDRYRMLRKWRLNTPQNYSEGPYEEFTLIAKKHSISFSFKKSMTEPIQSSSSIQPSPMDIAKKRNPDAKLVKSIHNETQTLISRWRARPATS